MKSAAWKNGSNWVPLVNREQNYNRIYLLPIDPQSNKYPSKMKIRLLDESRNTLADFAFDDTIPTKLKHIGDLPVSPNPQGMYGAFWTSQAFPIHSTQYLIFFTFLLQIV
ncbi:hypothetical protein DSO57_1032926 [Entomophthora muscae]|uniref:Uncharacterized protein n=1 Tax=Entomophthora muscae TaxID=34485 RepID=A0ACC2TB06_9FUNG|nr:hypothetical protein DSO57_1032926 [Entomophthora muscae]